MAKKQVKTNQKNSNKKRKVILLSTLIPAAAAGAGVGIYFGIAAGKKPVESREIVIDDTTKSQVTVTSTKTDKGIEINLKTTEDTKTVNSIDKVTIGDTVLDPSQYTYDKTTGKLTIEQKILDENPGAIVIYPMITAKEITAITVTSANHNIDVSANQSIEFYAQDQLGNDITKICNFKIVNLIDETISLGNFDTNVLSLSANATYYGGSGQIVCTYQKSNGNEDIIGKYDIEIASFNKLDTNPDSITSLQNGQISQKDGNVSGRIITPNRYYVDSLNDWKATTAISASGFNASNITEINISQAVTFIGPTVFGSGLKLITVDSKNSKFESPTDSNCVIAKSAPTELYLGCRTTDFSKLTSVTTIASKAFYGSGLTSITIPSTITSIGSSAFYASKDLSTVTFEGTPSITKFEDSTFGMCSSLTGFTIPNTITSLGASCFEACTRLSTMNIPSSVSKIGSNCFANCGSNLTSISFENKSGWFQTNTETDVAVTNQLNNASNLKATGAGTWGATGLEIQTTEFYFASDSARSSGLVTMQNETLSKSTVVVPTTVDGVTVKGIAEGGCAGSKATSITFKTPSNITTISSTAFGSCTNMTSFDVPQNVNSIGAGAFAGSAVTSVTIPCADTNVWIQKDATVQLDVSTATTNATNLKTGAWRNTELKTVAAFALSSGGCVSMTGNGKALTGTVTIPASINGTTITSVASEGCKNCNASVINFKSASSIKIIMPYAFQDCPNLTTCPVNSTFSSLTTIHMQAFYNPKFESVTLPDSLTTIKIEAFAGKTSSDSVLKTVSFGENSQLNEIGMAVFAQGKITDFIVPKKTTIIGASVFQNCPLSTVTFADDTVSWIQTKDSSKTMINISDPTQNQKNFMNTKSGYTGFNWHTTGINTDSTAIKTANINYDSTFTEAGITVDTTSTSKISKGSVDSITIVATADAEVTGTITLKTSSGDEITSLTDKKFETTATTYTIDLDDDLWLLVPALDELVVTFTLKSKSANISEDATFSAAGITISSESTSKITKGSIDTIKIVGTAAETATGTITISSTTAGEIKTVSNKTFNTSKTTIEIELDSDDWEKITNGETLSVSFAVGDKTIDFDTTSSSLTDFTITGLESSVTSTSPTADFSVTWGGSSSTKKTGYIKFTYTPASGSAVTLQTDSKEFTSTATSFTAFDFTNIFNAMKGTEATITVEFVSTAMSCTCGIDESSLPASLSNALCSETVNSDENMGWVEAAYQLETGTLKGHFVLTETKTGVQITTMTETLDPTVTPVYYDNVDLTTIFTALQVAGETTGTITITWVTE